MCLCGCGTCGKHQIGQIGTRNEPRHSIAAVCQKRDKDGSGETLGREGSSGVTLMSGGVSGGGGGGVSGGGVSMPWYHQDLTRVKAEQLLLQDGQDGCFLVRNSESIPGVYGLCVLHQNVVHSYRIMPDEDGMLAVQVTRSPTHSPTR
uniref:Phosphatidylinositol 3,4,5-trisphosphate 5-phosphatase 2-like n=1 Tax=Petromyzon marinus TaxID=7757 RepID=A0AAJ7SMG3_PETMA|nr:phosphatidylinositol 3,4,5-trisphosphate 5-phosphatase 2-like [Petromyzon marinus]